MRETRECKKGEWPRPTKKAKNRVTKKRMSEASTVSGEYFREPKKKKKKPKQGSRIKEGGSERLNRNGDS